MNPFTWNNRYSLGLPQTDSDHQALFRLAEQLYDAVKNGAAREQFDGYLARLASYARFHFEDEEAFMRRIGFPDFAQHHQEHEEFLDRLSSFENLFQSGSADLDKAMLDFLGSWLERHVLGTDQRLAQYNNSNAVMPGSRAKEKARATRGNRRHQPATEERVHPAT